MLRQSDEKSGRRDTQSIPKVGPDYLSPWGVYRSSLKPPELIQTHQPWFAITSVLSQQPMRADDTCVWYSPISQLVRTLKVLQCEPSSTWRGQDVWPALHPATRERSTLYTVSGLNHPSLVMGCCFAPGVVLVSVATADEQLLLSALLGMSVVLSIQTELSQRLLDRYSIQAFTVPRWWISQTLVNPLKFTLSPR